MSEIRRVAVIGAGTMGHGIAQVAAQAGLEVVLYDLLPEAIERGLGAIRANLEGGVARGKLTAEDRDATVARIRGELDLESAASGAQLIIEAAPERLDLKREIFAALDRSAAPSTLLASNTSSLAIAKIAEGISHPGRIVGMHFFNPVHLMALVEVVRGPASDESSVQRAVEIARAMGKEPIVVRDSPGFASSRLGVALGLEAMRMLEQGVASAEDIDRAMTLGYRHPMGPLRLTDLVGLDVRLAIAEYLERELASEVFRPPAILRQLVAEGRVGKKAGRGFYDW